MTQKADPNDANVEKRAEEQNELHREVADLARELSLSAAVEPLLEQAKQAALEASAAILESDRDAAVAEQKKVVGSLAQIEHALQTETSQPTDRSAEQLADQAKQLKEVAKQLEIAAQTQEQASAQAKDNVAAAKQAEAQTAQELNKAAAITAVPPSVTAKLEDAQLAVVDAKIS